ncbi:MAG: 3'-5' exoribonuclease domain-containing protein [Nostoc sp. DedVER02]|uniref:3'-5' exoribonuclease domain-containing protein n=1 Tax=Nostoc sp. DedVER01b TaxID=3075404 RepID=UPI002AD287C5|nr:MULTISPECIES: 3'-5' exoribonuclease [unclassified Nostoc]MDZ7986842.1 3'-5' exoribonuclease [Nostoc sp. DedVER02]MDZ8115744.1 3'-5' exoribonuclease [Nostoc sp. DedVER01b]
MKYFLDTEFIEDGKTIDLISIGIICEDGREFYGINWNCNFELANNWVKKNVLAQLPFRPCDLPSLTHGEPINNWYNRTDLAKEVAIFLGCDYLGLGKKPAFALRNDAPKPEFWGYYADYDWVVFCQMFGTMMELPKGFPMYCRDIKQWCDQLDNPKLPEQKKGEHNAIADARWNKATWEYLRKLEEDMAFARQPISFKPGKIVPVLDDVAVQERDDDDE